MTAPRKKPGWAFWTAVVLALPVLYVGSFGPACWCSIRGLIDYETTIAVYRPLVVVGYGEQWQDSKASKAIRWSVVHAGSQRADAVMHALSQLY